MIQEKNEEIEFSDDFTIRTENNSIVVDIKDKVYENVYDMFDDNIRVIFETYRFEFNDRITRSEICAKVQWYLDSLKFSGKLFSYNVVIDESNNPPDVIDACSAVLDVRIKVLEQDTGYYSRRFKFDVDGIKLITIT